MNADRKAVGYTPPQSPKMVRKRGLEIICVSTEPSPQKRKTPQSFKTVGFSGIYWLRGRGLTPRPQSYEPILSLFCVYFEVII